MFPMEKFRMPIIPSRSVYQLCIAMLFSLAAISSHAVGTTTANDTRYISDKLYVPLRAEQSDDSKTLNSGLPSGTVLKLLRDDSESGYSLVEMNNGTQGWVRSRYLTKEPTAALKLSDMEKKLGAATSKDQAALLDEMDSLKDQNKKLTEQNAAIQRQLDDIKQASGNVVKMTQQNRELIEKNQVLQSKVDSLEAVKEKFQDNSNMDQFIYGGLLVIATLIVSAIIDSIRRRRSYSSWG